MGQYWKLVSLDRYEYVSPHRLGCGMKLCEQLGTYPGTGAALIVLLANMRKVRGGGDFDLDKRLCIDDAVPMPDEYPAIARRTIGRWAGTRVVLVGDYAEDPDLSNDTPMSEVYRLCDPDTKRGTPWTDISEDVCSVIEHELGGRFMGDPRGHVLGATEVQVHRGEGWRSWIESEPANA